MLLLLEEMAESGLAILPPERHAAYARAMLASLQLGPPQGAEDLGGFGFSLAECYKLRLCLLKPIAYDLLRETIEMPRARFERRFGWDAYVARFGRTPASINLKLKIMMLTPGEWATLCAARVTAFPVPRRIAQLAC